MAFLPHHVEHTARRLLAAGRRRIADREAHRTHIISSLAEAGRILCDEMGATGVWAVGSIDAPWFDESSDVDIVVLGLERARAHEAERRLVQLFEAPVDLLRFEELTESFQYAVRREGRVIR